MSNTTSEICQSLREIGQSLKIILGMGQQTRATIWIGIADSQLQPGRLLIQDHKGRRCLNSIALRTYGNTPIGRYNVMGIRVSGPGTPYPTEFYGFEGIVILESQSQSNGDYLTLQGGRAAPNNDLLATKGGFRVNDRDMRSIIIALETIEGPIDCYCVYLEQDDSLFDQEDSNYGGSNYKSNYIEESSEDSEFQPEELADDLLEGIPSEEVPNDQWFETAMSDDGYV